MRLWHDDVRPAPEGWTWARTNAEAVAYLDANEVEEISLDHDLGYDGPPPTADDDPTFYVKGTADETGEDLVAWMVEHDRIPPKVTIHSWNHSGAARMAWRLRDAGVEPEVRPYVLERDR